MPLCLNEFAQLTYHFKTKSLKIRFFVKLHFGVSYEVFFPPNAPPIYITDKKMRKTWYQKK